MLSWFALVVQEICAGKIATAAVSEDRYSFITRYITRP